MAKEAEVSVTLSTIDRLEKQYGSLAFGLVSVLLLWYLVFKPELAQQRIEYRSQQQIVAQMETVAKSMEASQMQMESVAKSLENAARLMDKTAGHLKQ